MNKEFSALNQIVLNKAKNETVSILELILIGYLKINDILIPEIEKIVKDSCCNKQYNLQDLLSNDTYVFYDSLTNLLIKEIFYHQRLEPYVLNGLFLFGVHTNDIVCISIIALIYTRYNICDGLISSSIEYLHSLETDSEYKNDIINFYTLIVKKI
ncbi:MAG: hypothetical protein Q4Q17_01480 [Tissierellia bacterium]|nr:hypothetical protein [Tissierellia bacterium]